MNISKTRWHRIQRICLWAIAGVGGALFIYTLLAQWDAVVDAIGHVDLKMFVALTSAQLLTFVIRTFCWEVCVRASKASTPSAALHLAAAASFFTTVLGPAHLAPAARVAALKRSSVSAESLPSRGQMVAADGVLLMTYAFVCAIFLAVSVGAETNLLTRALIGGGCVIVIVVAYLTRRSYSDRKYAQPLRALRSPTKLMTLLLGAGLTLSLQVWRWRSVLHGVGFPRLTTLDSALTYLLTTLSASPVPIGPGLYKIASPIKAVPALVHPKAIIHSKIPVTLAHSQGLAHAVAAIIILTLSALIAACAYAALTLLLYDRPAAARLLRIRARS